MIVEAINPETGEKIAIEIPSLDQTKLNDLVEEHATEKQIISYIERLPISAEVKALIVKFSKYTIKIGETVFRFGKKILEIVIMLASKFQLATFGLLLGAFLTFLIGLLPFIGPALAGFLGPLLMLLGLAKGVWEDLKKDKPEIAASIVDAGDLFSPLQTVHA